MSRSTLGALPVRTPVTGAPPAQADPFAELQRRVEDLQANMPDEVRRVRLGCAILCL
jgi:hypothetical protein